MQSWRTTILGIIGGLMLLLPQLQAAIDNDPTTNLNYEQVIAAFALLGAGIAARDNKVSSEKAGAK